MLALGVVIVSKAGSFKTDVTAILVRRRTRYYQRGYSGADNLHKHRRSLDYSSVSAFSVLYV